MPTPVPVAAAAAEDLKVEFAEEDPERHVVRPVSTKGNVDIQDALAKLRTSVATMPAKPAVPVKAAPPTLDRRLQDVLGAVADETRQDVRKKVTVDVPADLLRGATAVKIQVVLERSGSDIPLPLPEPIVLKYSATKKLERVNVRVDLEIKTK